MPTPFRGYPRVGAGAQPDGRAAVNALADAVDADVQLLSTGYRLAQIAHYTSSGVFQKGLHVGMRAVLVECVGGGGGSAFSPAADSSHWSFGRGGAGGAYTRSWFTAADLASSETVTVGAGGAAGTSGTPAGDGGDTTFGAHVTAGGGDGGGPSGSLSTAFAVSGFLRDPGGEPSGSYLLGIVGEGGGSVDGEAGPALTNVTGLAGGASGGPYGMANHPTVGAALTGITAMDAAPGLGYGGGALGTVVIPSSAARDGAAGAAGVVIVWVFL